MGAVKANKFTCTMSFIGTGIGAGILFLPLQASVGGIICFLVSAVVAFFFSIISHKIYTKLAIDCKEPRDYPVIVKSYLGKNYSIIVTVFFFLLTLGYLSVYIIGLNVGFGVFLKTCDFVSYDIQKSFWFIFSIVAVLVLIVSLNPKLIAEIMSFITLPLILMLTGLSVYLIRYWNLDYLTVIPTTKVFITGFLFNIPLLIFAVMFFPPITSMVRIYRSKVQSKENMEREAYKILRYTQIVLLGFIIFFTISTSLAACPKALHEGLASNISIMNVLAIIHKEPILKYIGPVVAILAILTSFLGYYFGTRECARNLIRAVLIMRMGEDKSYECDRIINSPRFFYGINFSIGIFLIAVALLNFNVEKILGMVCGPILAIVLYITPFLILNSAPVYKKYRGVIYWALLPGAALIVLAYPLACVITKVL